MTRRLLAVLAIGMLAATGAMAQEPSKGGGSITGAVADETGDPLPGTLVTLSGGGPSRFYNTSSDGKYRFQNVGPGTYKLTASLIGFGSQVQDATVNEGAELNLPFTLSVVLREEVVVVSASKGESQLINAPATMSVVTSDQIAAAPAQNYGDLLRSVPGLNVIQTSARDINIVSRESTATLTNSQLALVDGRSIYLDFFGLILWDFVPANTADIKQIEVVRGPASVVWGANALTGVINIITKSPREAPGGSIVLSGGTFSRDAGSTKGEGAGGSFGGTFSWAAAPNDTWSYKLAAGFYHSDAYPRPAGRVPVCGPRNPCLFNNPVALNVTTGGTPYPPFGNSETKQPKFELRVDQELSNGGRINYSGGYAGTRGIVHTGIGPFDIESGSYLAYGRIGYTKGALKLSAFGNFLDADAPNLLQTDVVTGKQVQLGFKTQTYDFEVGNSNVFGVRHVLTYGGNARRNNFDITITPAGENRSEFGAYVQEEVFWDRFRLALGGRVDKFGNIDKAVFSPRISAMIKPTADHSIRLSFNKAFRAPSLINNYLDTRTFSPQDLSRITANLGLILGAELLAAGVPAQLVPAQVAQLLPILGPAVQNAFGTPASPKAFPVVIHSQGSEVRRKATGVGDSLQEESLRAYEIAYTGSFGGKTTIGLAYYINDRDDNINFVSDPVLQKDVGLQPYSAANPPPGWPKSPVPAALCPTCQPLLNGILSVLAAQGTLIPSSATYLNLAPTRNQGFEASIDHTFRKELSGFANYSYQKVPEAKAASGRPFPVEEFGVPPKHRVNVGLNWNSKRLLGSASVNYADKAFWTDVLSATFFGPTDSYTMVNASFGVKWGSEGKIVTSVKGTNLANKDIQQHIFGDIIKRSIVGEVRFAF